jgi:hypothetical protein
MNQSTGDPPLTQVVTRFWRERQAGRPAAEPPRARAGAGGSICPGACVAERDGGEQGDGKLRVDGVGHRERHRLEVPLPAHVELVEQHAETAEAALQEHEGQQGVGGEPHEPARFPAGVRDAERDDQQPEAARREPVGMLRELVDLGEPAGRVDRAVRERPIQEGHAGLDARGEAAGLQDQHRPEERRGAQPQEESVRRGAGGCGHAFIRRGLRTGANPFRGPRRS